MIILGIVLHGIIAYTTQTHGSSWPFAYEFSSPSTSWPYHDPQASYFFDVIYNFIHIFRMPLFFVLSGFFTHLISAKKGNKALFKSRLKRILYPLLVFWPIVFPLVGGGMMFLMGAFENGQLKQNGFANQDNLASVLSPIHLWFLYYLLYFYPAILAIQFALNKLPQFQNIVRSLFAKAFMSSWSILIFALPLFVLLAINGGWVPSASNFIPDFPAMLVYFTFFLFGWFLYLMKSEIGRLKTHAWIHLGLGSILTAYLGTIESLIGTNQILLVSFISSLAVWCLIFSITGLFIQHFSKADHRLTYLAESSYWLYIIHLPIVIWLVVALKGFEISTFIKAIVVLVLSHIILLISYEYAVRKTFIGRFLNGR